MQNRKYIFITIIVAGAMLCLAGCGQYKKFTSPDTSFADDLYSRMKVGHGASSDSTTLASMNWPDLFTDTLLQTLIYEGLNNNTDLRIAMLKVQESEYVLQASKKAFIPSLNFGADIGVSNQRSGTSSDYSAKLNVQWEIDAFGKLLNAKRASEMSYFQKEAARQAVEAKLIATIADSYYTLLMLDEQLAISLRTVKNWEENIRTLRALKGAGKANQASVLQAEANKLNVAGSILTLRKQISAQENALSVLLGRVPGTIKRSTLGSQAFPETLSYGVPLQMIERRPDVREAEFALAEAYYNVNYARAFRYPSLTLGGTGGWMDALGQAVSNPGTWIVNAVASLAQPIFNKGKIKADIQVAQAKQEEAQLRFVQKVLDAGAEVNNALQQWQTARARINVDKRQIATLSAAVSNTSLLMRNGRADYLQVLTAQQTLLSAELAHASDRFDEIQGVIRLYHTLGR